jgi:poly(A) polymerase
MFFFREKVVVRNREAHNISRKNIDPDALRVLCRLADAGFTAYLVGGSVRDLLLDRHPKDFDISTDAHPNQIRKLFRNCFLIGRRFRLAHIVFGKKVIETSTFRKQPEPSAKEDANGALYQHEDNTFGSPEEDARRRDFTVNGLFYDIRTFSVIDYVGGLRDLERRTLCCIGDPNIRFREDPVRMMRAIRFAARLDFTMDWGCRRAIRRHYAEILNATTPRLLEEITRLFGYGRSSQAFRLLWEYRLMSVLLPEIHEYITRTGGDASPLWAYLTAFDNDQASATSSGGLRFAVLFAPLYQEQAESSDRDPFYLAQKLLDPLVARMRLPRQAYTVACMLLEAQSRFQETASQRARHLRFARHDLFPEALALRRIALAANGENADLLRAWEALSLAATRAPDATAQEPGDDVPADEAVEGLSDRPPIPDDQPRRRRRGGRRNRRNIPPVQMHGDLSSPATPPGIVAGNAQAPEAG